MLCRGAGRVDTQVRLDSCIVENDSKAQPVVVSAPQLYTEALGDEDAAQIKYGGMPLLVTGTIADVGKDDMGASDVHVVHLAAPHATILARLADNVDAKTVKRGQKITLRCASDTLAPGGAIWLGDCPATPEVR